MPLLEEDLQPPADLVRLCHHRWAAPVLIIWFLVCLALANLIPQHLIALLEQAGYTECETPQPASRVSRGESRIYGKGPC